MKLIFNPLLLLTLALLGVLTFSGCEDDDMTEPMEPGNRTSGFVIVGTTPSETALVKYVDELPSDEVSMDDAQDFPQFFPNAKVDNALFLARPDRTAGFAKFVVNADGMLEREGVLPAIDPSSFRIDVRDSGLGVYQDRATPQTLTVFNPTTLEVTGTIDMSEAPVPGDIDQRYQRFTFRGDDVFAPIRGNDGTSFPSFVVHQADLSTNSYVGSTQRDGNGFSSIITFNSFNQRLVDEDGDLYLPDAGNYDGAGIQARVNVIRAGRDTFDTEYEFFPAQQLNPANTFLPTFNTFTVVADGLAVARVNSETPQAAIDIVTQAGGVQNLSSDQIMQVLGILFSSETARWCLLDLDARTVTPIDGIPATGVFAGGSVFFHEGDAFIPAITQSEAGYYRYEPGSGTATRAFTVSGAEVTGVYNIGNDE